MSTPSNYLQPAQMTTLGNQGHGFLPRTWFPNSGLYLRAALPNVPSDGFASCNNLRWNGISWTTQNIGWTAQRATPFNSGAQIMEMATHWKTDGTPIYLHQAGTAVQTYNPLVAGSTETTVFTAANQTIPCFRSYSPNYLLYCNGVDKPQSFNGTTWSAMSLFPFTSGGQSYSVCNLVENFNNRAAYAGWQGNPFAVLISDYGNPNSCTIAATGSSVQPTNGGIYFVPSACGPITSLKVARVSQATNEQVLLIGCTQGFCFITGLDATSFSLISAQQLKWGVPSNRCWFQLNDNIYCLCTDGIRAFNTNTTYSNLIADTLSLPVHPLIAGMSTGTQMRGAFCLDNPAEQEVTFYFPSGQVQQNTTALIMNYADTNSGVTRFSQKQFPYASTVHPSCGQYYQGNYYCGGYNGILQQMYTSSTWNGAGIAYSCTSSLWPANTPAEEASIQGVYIMTQGAPAFWNVSATPFKGRVPSQNNGSVAQGTAYTQPVYSGIAGETILGSWVLGQSAMGGQVYDITRISPPGAGRAWQLGISGNTANGDMNLIGAFGTLLGGGTRQ